MGFDGRGMMMILLVPSHRVGNFSALNREE